VAAAVLVDSNVILDVATNNPRWGVWSAEMLASAADESILVINPLIYAEVSVGFNNTTRDCSDCGAQRLECASASSRSLLPLRRLRLAL
jgi:uncharacterized protein YciU (UPF0263 family)